MSRVKYFTIQQVEDYISRVRPNSDTGRLSLREALILMDKEGLLFTDPGTKRDLSFWLDHEAFARAYAGIPIDASLILGLSESEYAEFSYLESASFPPGQDVFPRKLIPGDRDTMRSPDFFEIYYVCTGSFTMHFSGDMISLKEGDLCVIPPKAPHMVTVDEGVYVWDILVRGSTFDARFGELMTMSGVFSGFFRESLYGASSPNFLLMHAGAQNDGLLYRLQGLVAECCFPGDPHINGCAANWTKLFLVQALRDSGNRVEIYRFPTGGNPRADCGEILQYIRQNYRTVRLSTLAREFHYNETYLSRMLQNYAHQSFTDIVREARMNRAVEYLTNSSLRIHEIAVLVGYSSVDHFSRAFKAFYGVSPQSFRRKNRS